jgi:hypothetical protein
MGAHMIDHFIFTARRLSERTKSIVFATVAFAIFANFWWFRGVAWGIDGPINDHWGLGWRQVRSPHPSPSFLCCRLMGFLLSRGTFTSRIESVCGGQPVIHLRRTVPYVLRSIEPRLAHMVHNTQHMITPLPPPKKKKTIILSMELVADPSSQVVLSFFSLFRLPFCHMSNLEYTLF